MNWAWHTPDGDSTGQVYFNEFISHSTLDFGHWTSGLTDHCLLEDNMAEKPIHILLVDDDEDDYIITRDLLQEAGGSRFNLE